ncbi:hypothetical protein HK15_13400 [Acetobacter orientalis]|uniref:Uncharacterized protein n=1 Tax=Acetobacter orientalis TaxID=146474 RepID=A0A252B2P0_9PROT|nr:hypothetical protein HK15_13400 [Acetobacter orientalis]
MGRVECLGLYKMLPILGAAVFAYGNSVWPVQVWQKAVCLPVQTVGKAANVKRVCCQSNVCKKHILPTPL